MRVIGIDYGAARVGVALGDTETKVATPWKTLQNRGRSATLAQIRDLATQEQAQALVVGIPHLPGHPAEGAQQIREIRRFISDARSLGLPLFEENEMFTSRLAARQIRETGKRDTEDELAAAAILQSWLVRQ